MPGDAWKGNKCKNQMLNLPIRNSIFCLAIVKLLVTQNKHIPAMPLIIVIPSALYFIIYTRTGEKLALLTRPENEVSGSVMRGSAFPKDEVSEFWHVLRLRNGRICVVRWTTYGNAITAILDRLSTMRRRINTMIWHGRLENVVRCAARGLAVPASSVTNRFDILKVDVFAASICCGH